MSPNRQRIDRWLWNARVVRTRTAAAELVAGGRVRINAARVTAPGRDVKCGDVVTVTLNGGVRVLRVTGMAPRRGDASAAALLYDAIADADAITGGAPHTDAENG